MVVIRAASGILALCVALFAGIWLGGNPSHLPAEVRSLLIEDTGGLTSEAAGIIHENYFREVSDRTLQDASISGMVRQISRENEDRFSHYFDPAAMERFAQAISGSFSGVGLSVVEVPRGLRVGRVFNGTPAQEAGITTGEVVVEVEGESIAGRNAEEVTAQIKGPEGTEVVLGIEPAQGGRARQVRLVRREIQLPPTRATMRERDGMKLGYLQFAGFSRDANRYVRRSVKRLRDQGAEGIVLDLRGNGGGLLGEAILTSSIFVEAGEVVVSTRSRSEGERVYRAVGGNLPPGPMVILINRDTASAAEILAAALSEDLNAPLVGTRTYGKGVFQKVIDLSNGGALDLTIGEYFTASGVSLAGEGLKPDVKARDNPKTRRDEGLQKALRVLHDEVSSGTGMGGDTSSGASFEPADQAANGSP